MNGRSRGVPVDSVRRSAEETTSPHHQEFFIIHIAQVVYFTAAALWIFL